MRIGLFDDWWRFGHVVDFVDGVTRAALDEGHELVLFTPGRPAVESKDADRVHWVEVDDLAGLSERDRQASARMGAVVRRVVSKAREADLDIFCDLDWRRHQRFASRLVRAAPAVSSVVHRLGYLRRRPSPRPAQRRRGPSVAALRRLTRAGDRFVVHTATAEERLSAIVGSDHVVRAGWPVPPLAAGRRGRDDSGLRLLWVGGRRPDKGWEVLLGALARLGPDGVGRPVSLTVVGAEANDGARPAQVGEIPIRYDQRRLSSAELATAYDGADLATVLHLPEFAAAGRVSASLLSAVSAACPVLVSSSLADQLPASYGGLVVVEPTADAVAEGLREVAPRVDELAAAAGAGPTLIAEQHSYRGYLDAILFGAGDPTGSSSA